MQYLFAKQERPQINDLRIVAKSLVCAMRLKAKDLYEAAMASGSTGVGWETRRREPAGVEGTLALSVLLMGIGSHWTLPHEGGHIKQKHLRPG